MSEGDFIPAYLDKEPAAFLGLSISELGSLVGKAFLVVFPLLSFLLVVATGMVIMIFLSLIFSMGISVGYARVRAAAIREESKGKPVYFSQHKLAIALEKLQLKYQTFFPKFKPYFIVKDGLWGR